MCLTPTSRKSALVRLSAGSGYAFYGFMDEAESGDKSQINETGDTSSPFWLPNSSLEHDSSDARMPLFMHSFPAFKYIS